MGFIGLLSVCAWTLYACDQLLDRDPRRVLGGSRVVISGVISMVTIVITHIRGFITLLTATHEPPSALSEVGNSD